MKWPLDSHFITQRYGNRNKRYRKGYHTGVDIAAGIGSKLYAAHSGIAGFVGWNNGYGNEVRIIANTRFLSSYHHLSRFNVRVGQKITEGQVIGFSGNTGMSTGPHLHFEIRVDGKDVDPMPYLNGTKPIPGGSDPKIPNPNPTPQPNPGDKTVELGSLVDWVTSTDNWKRLAMIVAGGGLIIIAGVRIIQNAK